MSALFGLGPFLVPLGAFVVAIVAIIGGSINEAQKRRHIAEERLALIARGIPVADIQEPEPTHGPVKDPLRSLGNARRTGIVLTSSGVGLILFFAALALILREPVVLSGAAVGLIPLAIGIGFFIDYNLQKRELSRFGMELPDDPNEISPRR